MKKIIVINFLFFFTLFLYPQESAKYLFINTYPIRAKVFIDGKDSNLSTPCILHNVVQKIKITIKKDGYSNYELSEAEVISKKFYAELTPSSFDLYFPEKTKYQIGSTELNGPVFVSKLKSGKYDITVAKNKILFSKSSVFLPFEVGVGTAFGLSLSFMVGSIAMSEYYASLARTAKYTGNAADFQYYSRTTDGIDIAKISSIGVTSFLGLALIGLIIADVIYQYKSKTNKMEISNKSPSSQDKLFYDSAIQFLSIGEINRSTQVLQTIVTLFPQSELMPVVYYQLGQNYFISQDYDNALSNWETFIREYPIADYYDYVMKNLADIYYTKKDLKTARNYLERIVFSDNMLNKELVYSFKAKLDAEIFTDSGEEENYSQATNEFNILIDNFSASERLDTYFSQLLKLYNLKSDADKITELKTKAENLTGIDEKVKELILSYFK
jgi:outer membrane protein assembly factor BamD (BamD/ComL family)